MHSIWNILVSNIITFSNQSENGPIKRENEKYASLCIKNIHYTNYVLEGLYERIQSEEK